MVLLVIVLPVLLRFTESEQVCICILGLSICALSTILIVDFGIVVTV